MKRQGTSIPGVGREMLSPEYWVAKLEERQSPTEGTRADCQAALRRHSPGLADLRCILAYPSRSGFLPEAGRDSRVLFDEAGEPWSDETWSALLENVNLPRPGDMVPGFTIRSTNVRTYPTMMRAYRTSAHQEHDQFQETSLHTFEPVLCLCTSRDLEWMYVISQTYAGWVPSVDIATTSKTEFERFLEPEDVWVVTGVGVRTQVDEVHPDVSGQLAEFAAYLPISRSRKRTSMTDARVVWPTRAANGAFVAKEAVVRLDGDVHCGYLPFTRESVIRMAFQLIGEPYGWGGSFGRHDCSSFVMDVYRLVGVQLPRNTGDQEYALPNGVPIDSTLSTKERLEVLETLLPGALLFMPGHVMLYLGGSQDRQYVIHDFTGYTTEISGRKENVAVNEVMVSPLHLELSNGNTYLGSLTGALDLFNTRNL